jgi:hypothetical protein
MSNVLGDTLSLICLPTPLPSPACIQIGFPYFHPELTALRGSVQLVTVPGIVMAERHPLGLEPQLDRHCTRELICSNVLLISSQI